MSENMICKNCGIEVKWKRIPDEQYIGGFARILVHVGTGENLCYPKAVAKIDG